jgi:hypothetical protein
VQRVLRNLVAQVPDARLVCSPDSGMPELAQRSRMQAACTCSQLKISQSPPPNCQADERTNGVSAGGEAPFRSATAPLGRKPIHSMKPHTVNSLASTCRCCGNSGGPHDRLCFTGEVTPRAAAWTYFLAATVNRTSKLGAVHFFFPREH